MNQKEIKELIELLVEKDIAEFEMERGDVKLHIKRGGEVHAPQVVHMAAPVPVSVPVAAPPASRGDRGEAGRSCTDRGCRRGEPAYREVAYRRHVLRVGIAGFSTVRGRG